MLSALSRQGNVRFMLYEDSMNQQRLIQFMDRLIRTSNQKVFLILDNLKVHHGKKTAAWLDRRQDKIELFFLPPYAPESNPDEYLNHALKLSVHSGSLPQTKRDIRHKTASFMRSLQHCPDKVSAFFQHSQISYVLISGVIILSRVLLWTFRIRLLGCQELFSEKIQGIQQY